MCYKAIAKKTTRSLHGGEGVQRGKGSWSDAGDLVVVERQQTDGAEAGEGAVVDAGELVAPQHSGKKNQRQKRKHKQTCGE